MGRSRILVVGANGELGRAVMQVLGPERAVAATRNTATGLKDFDHVLLGEDGTPPAGVLVECDAVINAAGRITGDQATLDAGNIELPRKIALAAREAGVQKMVQVSSFSAFGITKWIDATTRDRPINAYGRSKVAGDLAIQGLATADFAIESLRLPFMFSRQKPGLLAPLLTLAQTFRMLPAVKGKAIRRSMLTYADAACTLVSCASDHRSGTTMAADPLLFDYPLLAKLIGEETSQKVGIFSLWEPVAKTVEAVLPGIGRRVFRSSVLDQSVNRVGDNAVGLETELRALIRNRYSN